MADNTTLNSGSGGDTIRTDDIGGIKYPTSKLSLGADGVDDGFVSTANPLPISDAGGSLTVDGTVAATQSGTWNITNVSGTVSLPTGAATAAKQPALGTAGSASADVISVQGIASMTPIAVSDNSGSLTVDNAGTFAVQVDGSALTALQKIDDPVLVDDAAFTPATSSVMMAGFQADETATDSIDEGDAGAARMTLDRKILTAPQPHSGGGLSIARDIDLDEGTLTVVKASPGCVYGMWVTNTAQSTRWIKFYDATSGTAGTGTPVITIGIPGNSTDDISGNFGPGGMGIAFATGICVGATTGVADADTGAPAANDLIVNIFFK